MTLFSGLVDMVRPVTAHDWLCGGAVLATTFGAFLALIWAEGRRS